MGGHPCTPRLHEGETFYCSEAALCWDNFPTQAPSHRCHPVLHWYQQAVRLTFYHFWYEFIRFNGGPKKLKSNIKVAMFRENMMVLLVGPSFFLSSVQSCSTVTTEPKSLVRNTEIKKSVHSIPKFLSKSCDRGPYGFVTRLQSLHSRLQNALQH